MMERTGPIDDPKAILRQCSRGFWGAITPNQSASEFLALLERVRAARPSCILEIGTANGGTLFAFTRVATAEAHLISLDLPGGAGGGGYPEWKIPLYERFALPGQRLDLVRDDSHDPAVRRQIVEILGGRAIDFLFIDGDHSYEGVRQDFETFAPLVRPGGLIAFHDTVFCEGVQRFWGELAGTGRTRDEFRADSGRVYGIGLMTWDGGAGAQAGTPPAA
jgi:cephalosporin hydroxylase